MNEQVVIRKAHQEDVAEIMRMMREFANFIGKTDQLIIDEAGLTQSIFVDKKASVLLAEVAGHVMGYTIYYPIYSSFTGEESLYIEDLYISPLFQHKGYGKEMFSVVREIAESTMSGSVEWKCLKWNTKARNFYEGIGAKVNEECLTYSI